MAPHSSTLAWKIPGAEEPDRLLSLGLQRVGHGWATSLSLFTFMHWRRKWQPTPVFLPGESQGWGSLVGCHLGGHRVRHVWSDLAAALISGKPSWFTWKVMEVFFFYQINIWLFELKQFKKSHYIWNAKSIIHSVSMSVQKYIQS